mmetsp:Transcript_3195/g.4053  ORF Transcript_3195/g.4053 Transcript_3195/m.4053 type:complete len:273 (-) Transcript_3195:1928-2746(-)|eukprot:CAMPEP_0204884824 /NCGR_PEP_ID=MMETSP1349-20130617/10978_1 /ASSEMBLY_ACC=CAM_ASM_000710 /TAXON_ID=215587 /ORGANISM="Aplanochytrium stocchinoi, Strain GSBS06" /LENGTH=272 /DNA_ID=CAMNT_0052045935 /DNA_START=31 /DNA_END=849 /DNA_ORIENTATION=-
MPKIKVNDKYPVELYYEEYGDGPETVVFSHGLLWSRKMFKYQIDMLQSEYRVIAYDHRGQGLSEVTEAGAAYDMDNLYEDAKDLIKKLELGSVHWMGLSMGGFMGQRLAARDPELIKSLVLMNTGCAPETFVNKFKNNMMCKGVAFVGVAPFRAETCKIMFGKKFMKNKERKEDVKQWTRDELLALPKTIVRAVYGVNRRKGIEEEIPNIKCPTLILVGGADKAQPLPLGKKLNQLIEGSQMEIIPGTGHTGSIESYEQYNEKISGFLKSLK